MESDTTMTRTRTLQAMFAIGMVLTLTTGVRRTRASPSPMSDTTGTSAWASEFGGPIVAPGCYPPPRPVVITHPWRHHRVIHAGPPVIVHPPVVPVVHPPVIREVVVTPAPPVVVTAPVVVDQGSITVLGDQLQRVADVRRADAERLLVRRAARRVLQRDPDQRTTPGRLRLLAAIRPLGLRPRGYPITYPPEKRRPTAAAGRRFFYAQFSESWSTSRMKSTISRL